ncbi:Autophagy-related protein 9A [Hypsibius exemplaris]|uniref:Autophagy-related protein 9 n=1 Tax=Hypsibius exemplaris TaxID=2072580 RepID=A0A1W0WTJ5_HYPEX|nr:Autophagy-related protein 9A [Hypsibius exemplaris]
MATAGGYHTINGGEDRPPVHDYPSGPSAVPPDHHHGGGISFSMPAEHNRSSKFHHVADLDKFFTRVYRYHQGNGFFCMMLQECLELVQFAYVVIFSTFLLECVDYDILFANKIPESWREWWERNNITFGFNSTTYGQKVTLSDAVIPTAQCVHNFRPGVILLIIVAAAFWLFRLAKVFSHFLSYSETRRFYRIALKIEDYELVNLTWHEVLQRLLSAQKVHQMCIHKSELTELDIYHRILRVENYLVSMINKQTLPVTLFTPFIGRSTFLSKSYLYNLEFILFRGIGSPFEHNWQLREEYKVYGRRAEVAAQLRRRIAWTALVNFIFCPVVLVWRILYAFFDYADIIKRDPGTLGSRRWSNYSRLNLRHFNELEHELNARLNRAYKPATMYMNIFTSPLVTILAKNVAFIAGSLLAVLIFCTVLDEDVLKVSHMLTTLTVLGVIVAGCRACIPDEHAVFLPENLLSIVISEIHYAPETWKGRAHTTDVRTEFAGLFQYRFSHICEELFSPVVTPFILYFCLREQSLAIVDFFRNFTVDLVGVGDVCSFAEMDVRKHGDPEWTPDSLVEPDRILDSERNRADQGKTELSLIHFKLMNPEWKPPAEAVWFMQKIREQVERGAQQMQTGEGNMQENAVLASLMPLGQRVQGLMCGSMFGGQDFTTGHIEGYARGDLKREEGALSGSGNAGLLNTAMTNSGMEKSSACSPLQLQSSPMELTAADMSFSALFMHELHRKRIRASIYQYGAIGEEQDEPPPPQLAAQSSRHSSRASRNTTEEEGSPLLDFKK